MATLAMLLEDGYHIAVKRRSRRPVLIYAIPTKERNEEDGREEEDNYFARAAHR